jgi:integrase
MKHPSLTEKAIEKALAAADKADELRKLDPQHPGADELRLFDPKHPGLVLWRRPRGAPRWYLFRRAAGRKVRVPLAEPSTYPALRLEQARGLYPALLTKLAAGEDMAKTRRANRVKEAAERKEQREAARGGRVPMRDVLDHMLARMRLDGRSDIHREEREKIINGVIAAGCTDMEDPQARAKAEKYLNGLKVTELTRFRYGQHIRALGKYAMTRYPEEDGPTRDPFARLEVGSKTIPPPPTFNLSEAFKLASDAAMVTEEGRLFAFLLFTGARMREATWARVERFDLDAATWSILPLTKEQREAGERLKRNKARTVNLMPELVELLRDWIDKPHGPFLFSDVVRGRSWQSTAVFRDHLDDLGIPVEGRHIHSLRHLHCTLAVACGMKDLDLRLSVGHAGQEMAAHYAAAAMLWKAKLAPWSGVFRLRDPGERARLVGTELAVAQ